MGEPRLLDVDPAEAAGLDDLRVRDLYVAGQQDAAGRDGTAKSRARERQGRHRLGGFIAAFARNPSPSGSRSRPRTFVPRSVRAVPWPVPARARPASTGARAMPEMASAARRPSRWGDRARTESEMPRPDAIVAGCARTASEGPDGLAPRRSAGSGKSRRRAGSRTSRPREPCVVALAATARRGLMACQARTCRWQRNWPPKAASGLRFAGTERPSATVGRKRARNVGSSVIRARQPFARRGLMARNARFLRWERNLRGEGRRHAARRHVQPALAERPRRELRAGRDVEALEQPAQVRLDRLRPDPEPRRDLVVRAALDDEPDDVELALAEPHRADRPPTRTPSRQRPRSGSRRSAP